MSEITAISVGARSEAWENEGGSLSIRELAERLGVIRHVIETYSVGEFRYTSLTDAIAQARRMAKLELEMLA
jgi:7-cyano-7-deazaguanine synthase in queuosine biosynthesis